MSRLIVHLYDDPNDENPRWSVADTDAQDGWWDDLNRQGAADKVARVVVRTGPDYQPGDHIRLLDDARPNDTDLVCVDPAVVADVNLNELDFADKAAGLQFVLNPGADFRLRVCLYDATTHLAPTIVLYEWIVEGFANLNDVHFADKAARATIAIGPAYRPGDHVRLLDDAVEAGTDTITLDPQVHDDLNLNLLSFARKTAAMLFVLNPGAGYRLRVDLHDQLGQPFPNLTLYDWQRQDPIDLNPLNFADKAARIVVTCGGQYQPGDHVRLLDEVRLENTRMVTVDPLAVADLNLNLISFADSVAAMQFLLNPATDFRTRIDLYDQVGQPFPNLSLYDWQQTGALIDLNPLKFADTAARVVIVPGRGYHPGDHVRVLDDVLTANTDMATVDPQVVADVDLNRVNLADKAAAVQFVLNPGPDYRLRVDLHDELGQPFPNISLYDWQQTDPPIDLNILNFADKVARVVTTTGRDGHPGDHVRLFNVVRDAGTDAVTADPLVEADLDLDAVRFADAPAALEFILNPDMTYGARVDLYDQVDDPLPILSFYDWENGGSINLNVFNFADRPAKLVITKWTVLPPFHPHPPILIGRPRP